MLKKTGNGDPYTPIKPEIERVCFLDYYFLFECYLLNEKIINLRCTKCVHTHCTKIYHHIDEDNTKYGN